MEGEKEYNTTILKIIMVFCVVGIIIISITAHIQSQELISLSEEYDKSLQSCISMSEQYKNNFKTCNQECINYKQEVIERLQEQGFNVDIN